jgi:hypothetical protein
LHHYSSYPQRNGCWYNAFRTLEFKISTLFRKNVWWLISRTTQNTTSKHKNCTIFPLILKERDAENTRYQSAKTQKMTTFSWRCNSKFWGYLWRTSDISLPIPHKTRLLNLKIAPYFLSSSEKRILIKRVQNVGIQNFDVIYEEQMMAHIQNHTKQDFET